MICMDYIYQRRKLFLTVYVSVMICRSKGDEDLMMPLLFLSHRTTHYDRMLYTQTIMETCGCLFQPIYFVPNEANKANLLPNN